MKRRRAALFASSIAAFILLLAVAACGTTSNTTPVPPAPSGEPPETSAEPPATGEPEPAPDGSESPDEVTLELGDGPFDLVDPAVGLADLTDYVATLAITFDGTRAGSPTNVSTSTTISVWPGARQLTIERGTDGPTTYRAEVSGISYTKEGDEACSSGSIDETDMLAASYEPAAELYPLGGADDAGSETVNGIATHRYSFDRQSVVALNIASATGEVWVADDGGYVVRYDLTLDAGPDFYGEGVTGTRTVHYELSALAEPVAIELPSDCTPPVDAPLLSDATDVVSRPRMISFASNSSLADAADFYTTELTARGWEASTTPVVSESTAVLQFTRDEGTLFVVMHGRDQGIKVTVVVSRGGP